jgi:hypothetical protein
MRSIRGGLFALLIAALTASPAMASEKPFNLALISPIALVKPENGVSAVRLNLIYGENTSVKGLDLGLINRTTTLSSGLQWGFININDGNFKGLQISAFNYNKGTTDGLQWSTFNYAGTAGGTAAGVPELRTESAGNSSWPPQHCQDWRQVSRHGDRELEEVTRPYM